ncbi:hypothetical protein EI94DRAFT_1751510 [Lactarius quietus]|nr:hypothetical protein EI94DRAFT_1751510 [Lactarius quietus]
MTSASRSSSSSSSSSPFLFRTAPNPSISSSSDSTAWSSTNSERFFSLALSLSRCSANLAPSISSENAVRPCIIIPAGVALPFVLAGEGDGDGDNDWPRGYAYRLCDAVTGASGLVCARRRRRSGSRPTDDSGDVSASVLSGWRAVVNGLDAAVPECAVPSTLPDCVRRSASYGRWDGDGLYTSGLDPSGRVCVKNPFSVMYNSRLGRFAAGNAA